MPRRPMRMACLICISKRISSLLRIGRGCRGSASGQTNLAVSNLPPGQGFFQLETPNTIRPGFDQQILDRNDDDSTGIVPMGFFINFFGNSNATLYVNNNGNVTFDSSAIGVHTLETLASLGIEVIAPFWADVDTRQSDFRCREIWNQWHGGWPCMPLGWTG